VPNQEAQKCDMNLSFLFFFFSSFPGGLRKREQDGDRKGRSHKSWVSTRSPKPLRSAPARSGLSWLGLLLTEGMRVVGGGGLGVCACERVCVCV
jgi:hypothetical protein